MKVIKSIETPKFKVSLIQDGNVYIVELLRTHGQDRSVYARDLNMALSFFESYVQAGEGQ